MERFDFHSQGRDFVAEPSRRYIGQLPEYMADNSLPHDVARVVLFQLAERNGTTLRLMSGAHITLEVTNYMIGGHRLVRTR